MAFPDTLPSGSMERCPMVANGDEAGRMEEGCGLRAIYAEGAQAHHTTFRDAADGSLPRDPAQLLFAAMIGVNMLSRAAGDTDWIAALEKSVLDAAAHPSAQEAV